MLTCNYLPNFNRHKRASFDKNKNVRSIDHLFLLYIKGIIKITLIALCIHEPIDTHAQPHSLHFERVTLNDGPTSEVITAITRDYRGYLWVGTQDGLVRYDGKQTKSFYAGSSSYPGLEDDFITTLFTPANSNSLWIGTTNSGLQNYPLGSGGFHTIPTSRDSTSLSNRQYIRAIFQHVDGHIWTGTNQGLFHFTHEITAPNRQYAHRLSATLFSDTLIHAVVASPFQEDSFFVSTQQGLFKVSNENLQTSRVRPPSSPDSSQYTIVAFAQSGGQLWGVTENGWMCRIRESAIELVKQIPIAAANQVFKLVGSKKFSQIIWIGTRSGLFAFDTISYAITQYQSGNGIVYSLYEDSDDILWVGTFNGLYKAMLDPIPFSTITPPLDDNPILSSPQKTNIFSIHANGDDVWHGKTEGGLRHLNTKTGEFKSYFSEDPSDPLSRIFSMHMDATAGQLWLAAESSSIYRMQVKTGQLTAFPFSPNTDIVKQFYPSPTNPNILWIATQKNGLLAIDKTTGAITHRYDQRSTPSLSSLDVWAVHADITHPHIMWVGTHDGGLNRLNVLTDSISVFRKNENNCLPSDRIVDVIQTADTTLWLGTFDQGLVRFNPAQQTCVHYNDQYGATPTSIGSLYLDAKKRLWIPTANEGLFVFNPATETFTLYNNQDGLQGNSFPFLAQDSDPNGTLYLGGEGGLNIINTNDINITTHTRKSLITDVQIQGESLSPSLYQTSGPLELAPDQRDVSFSFSTLNLSHPERSQYRVRLEPGDKKWSIPNGNASHRYTRLSPDSYTLHVIGTNKDGVWQDVPTTFSFTISQYLWERWFFWPLLSLSILLLVIAAFQYRIVHLRREKRMRGRIANDLHDDLGTKLTNMALEIDTIGLRFQDDISQKIQERLKKLARDERLLIEDLRLIVWLVDADYDRMPKSIERMELTADQLLRTHRYTFELTSPIPDIAIPMDRRKNLFLWFQEALNNIVRHANATYVTISIWYEQEKLHITIEDDGSGFDIQTVRKGQGLKSMQSRIQAMNGIMTIQSKPGEGTKLIIAAYITPQRGLYTSFRQWIRHRKSTSIP